MEPKVAPVAAVQTIGTAQVQPVSPALPGQAGPEKASDPAELRLVIEEDQASGSYVYKTIDRKTGKVVQQLPRDEVLKLREALRYEVGSLVKSKA